MEFWIVFLNSVDLPGSIRHLRLSSGLMLGKVACVFFFVSGQHVHVTFCELRLLLWLLRCVVIEAMWKGILCVEEQNTHATVLSINHSRHWIRNQKLWMQLLLRKYYLNIVAITTSTVAVASNL